MSTLLLNTLTGKTSAGSIVVTGEGGSTTTNLQQGVAKAWLNYKQAATFVTNDSFNISSVNDDGTGDGDTNYTNNFGNANYAAVGGSGRVLVGEYGAYWTFLLVAQIAYTLHHLQVGQVDIMEEVLMLLQRQIVS